MNLFLIAIGMNRRQTRYLMSRYPLIIVTSILFIFSSCIEGPEIVIDPQVGTEVQFGLSLEDGIKTRTVYGVETPTGFPVYWVHGDRVIIASPECLEGRNSARYEVACSTNVQSKADALNKVDAAGVQWGDSKTATFYSIYPAIGNDLSIKNGNVDATLTVASTQYAKISQSSTDNTTYAQPADMGNVIMYATASASNGDPVSLQYRPFSTVIEFQTKIKGMAAGEKPLTIQSITLSAPSTNIAGQFKFTFPQNENGSPSIAPINGTTSNSITIHFTENDEYKFVVSGQQTLKFKMCIMPIAGVSSMDGWKVVLATSAGNKSITLKSTDQDGKTTSLTPGKVHKIVLPELSYAATDWVYKNESWITSIPDYEKVYLTELSLPGAWYAGGKSSEGYQATDAIKELWTAGIRAFAVETKVGGGTSVNAHRNPEYILISGTGGNSDRSFQSGTNSLHPSETSKATVYKKITGSKEIGDLIEDIIDEITADQYAVLVLSYADGGESGRRYVDYGAWLQLLYEAYNGLGDQYKKRIFGYANGEMLNQTTTVKDVLNKLIIKVNIDENIAESGHIKWDATREDWSSGDYSYTYNDNLPSILSFNPFVSYLSSKDRPYYSKIYWKEWSDNYRVYTDAPNFTNGDFLWCFSSANRTSTDNSSDTTIPEYKDRKAALGAMMAKSKQIYEASTHNVWFYFNCGGTQATSDKDDNASPISFAKNMNYWLYDTVTAKLNSTDPSPLGIVMFNRCTDRNYMGPQIIEAIIKMNSRFYLKHEGDVDPERPITQFDDSLVGVDNWSTDFIQ